MLFTEYFNRFSETAVAIPVTSTKGYICLGLAGESSELLEKVLFDESIKDTLLEIGDTCWYLCHLSKVLAVEMEQAAAPKWDKFKTAATISIKCGLICDAVKKSLRDGRKLNLGPHMNAVLGLCAHLATLLGSSIQEVFDLNFAKLKSRKKRGAIKGSGDHR